MKSIFVLKIPFSSQCIFAQRYKVTRACSVVAVSVFDSNKFMAFTASEADSDSSLNQFATFVRLLISAE